MMERRLAAILAADVAGYSRLMHEDEEGTHLRLTQILRETVEPVLLRHGGHVVKHTGDGFLAEFQSVVAAVRCALEFQDAVTRNTASDSPERQVAFRVGIHIGDIIAESDDIFGDGVNIAARLEALAESGGILVSSMVEESTRGRLDCRFEDQGKRQLKNIARPVRVFRVRSGETGSAAADRPGSNRPIPDLPGRSSLVVLPFGNVTGDPEQEFLADGITEDITLALSRFRSLFVIARNSALGYKGRAVDIRQVGYELGVRYVLTGSVRKAGNSVRVTSALAQAETGSQLWSERHQGDLRDIFAIQDEITAEVAGAIAPAIDEAEEQRALRASTERLDAWEAYHRGLWHYVKSNAAENARARGFFERAIALDSTFSRAYQGLAFTYFDDAIVYATTDLSSAIDLAGSLARQAVVLDSNDAGAYVVLAYAHFATGDLESGLAAAEQALTLNPNFAPGYWSQAGNLLFLGRIAESREAARTFLRLSPRDPHNWRVLCLLSLGSYMEGDFAGCIYAAKQALRAHPGQQLAYRWLVAGLGQLGRLEEARAVMRDAAATLAPISFPAYAHSRGPWMRPAVYDLLADGLHKAGCLPERGV